VMQRLRQPIGHFGLDLGQEIPSIAQLLRGQGRGSPAALSLDGR
jgi:hypothetical protein